MWYGYLKAVWIRIVSYFKRMDCLVLRTKLEILSFHLNIWKCNHSVVVYLWLGTININMHT